MTLDEYDQTGKALYADFASVVADIIRAALKTKGEIRVQVVQKRAKASDEVRKKLDIETVQIETRVKDLAGVRIVVYTNSDVSQLNNSGILWENFDVVWDRTKIHYPHQGNEADESQFIGRNYVVRLKENRAGLTEYKRFAGLQCEVQVQTILDHAWSETAHDTIYKSPKLSGVGTTQMAKIKDRMREIQTKYLLRAGYEFQQVLNDFQQIVSGQRLVESDILVSIRDATDNNVRLEMLRQYESVVLPIIDDIAASAHEIRSFMVDAARVAVSTPSIPIETEIGRMPGYAFASVLEKIVEILSHIRYVDPAETYRAYADIYQFLSDAELKRKITEAVGKLAEHRLEAWQHHGPAVQEALLDAITETPRNQITSMLPIIVEVAAKCLQTEVTGTSSTSTAVTLKTGTVILSDRLHQVRDRALSILKDLFNSFQVEEDRCRIYSAMQSATRLSSRAGAENRLVERICRDTCTTIDFFNECAPNLGLLLKEEVEHDSLYHYIRAKDNITLIQKDERLRTAHEAVKASALKLRDKFNSDEEYLTFKTLVGFESVFHYEWERGEEDIQGKDEFRQARALELLSAVNLTNADEWFNRLNSYAAIKSNDSAMFPQLGAFVERIAQKYPSIGSSWLNRSSTQPLVQFRPGILRGLYASDPDNALNWIDGKINRGEELGSIAHFIRYAVPATPHILERVATAAINANENTAVYKILEACAARPAEFGMSVSRRLAIAAIKHLCSCGHIRWTDPLWTWGKRHGLLEQFDDEERAQLFAAITKLPEIDFWAEEILAIYGETYPSEVIDMFGARLELERAKELKAVEQYSAVPYDFSRLHQVMQASGVILLPKALAWHRADPHLGQYRSAQLVSIMFPEPPLSVVDQMISFARSNDRGAQDFVVDVMTNYNGADVAFTVLKELVAALPPNDELLRGVSRALGATGVMHGEFGRRDALVTEQSRLKSWLEDNREAVEEFARAEIARLENAIAAEQQLADSEIAMRKLEYGENFDDRRVGVSEPDQ